MPIYTACAAGDDTAAVHAQLGGSDECALDTGGDKVVYTYHLTRFGTARGQTVLEAMVANATPGSTVRVPAGTYAADVLVVDKPLAIEPADPDNPRCSPARRAWPCTRRPTGPSPCAASCSRARRDPRAAASGPPPRSPSCRSAGRPRAAPS